LANEEYSAFFKDQYGLTRDDLIFNIDIAERGKLRTRTVLRAEPNESFFNEIESRIPQETPAEEVEQNLLSLQKPELAPRYLTTSELIGSEDPIATKRLQDEIKKEHEELQDLINCLWK
jgi:hypothetical protein